MVWDESRLAVARINGFHATQAILVQLAISSALSKEGAKEFKKSIQRLNESGD